MTLAANIFDLLDPQAIFILLAVIIAAIKAFFEQKKNDPPEESIREETEFDPYQAYEEELARQRRDLQIEPPSPSPPPLTSFSPAPPLPPAPVRPKLSEAEQRALSNLNLQTRRRTKRSKDSTRARVYHHLSSPTAAREALLLAEVLGPPKALQDDR